MFVSESFNPSILSCIRSPRVVTCRVQMSVHLVVNYPFEAVALSFVKTAGSCKQVRWGLPLCGLVMLRCLNSTKIRCRWQCRAQCSGPCLRIAPVPLIPTSLGQPPAVFRSVYPTRQNIEIILVIGLCEFYVTVIMYYIAEVNIS